ncbi:MAG: FixH family protein [Bacteroidota bacterium]
MSWKYKIAALYIGFVAVILTGVIGSTQHRFQLVRTDYYEAEVVYQGRIDAMKNTKSLTEKPIIRQEQSEIVLLFPQALREAQGEVRLYRPSNQALDQTYSLALTEGQQLIPTQDLASGHYILQLEFEQGGKHFYQEQSLVLKDFAQR